MTRWCCNKAAPRACVGVGNCVCYVELAKQLPVKPGPTVNLEAKRSQNGTNMRGSSVSLANMEICKKIHRKSKCVSSRGEDTEVTVQLLKKMNCFQCLWEQDKQQWAQVAARKSFFRREVSSDSLISSYNEIEALRGYGISILQCCMNTCVAISWE